MDDEQLGRLQALCPQTGHGMDLDVALKMRIDGLVAENTAMRQLLREATWYATWCHESDPAKLMDEPAGEWLAKVKELLK